MHVTAIEGTFRLSDGSTTRFSIDGPESGWYQWGNDRSKLGETVDLLNALSDAAYEVGMGEEPDEEGEE